MTKMAVIKVFVIQNFMEIWYINLRKSLEIQTSLIKRAGYSLDIMRQTACLVFNPIMVEGYAVLFRCTALVQASDSMTASM